MAPRLDSRLTESDSAPESYRSQGSEPKRRIEETAYGNKVSTGKDRLRSNSESKVHKLSLQDICDTCDAEKPDINKSRLQYSKLQETGTKMATGRTPRKFSELKVVKERGDLAYFTPRNNKNRVSLPRI